MCNYTYGAKGLYPSYLRIAYLHYFLILLCSRFMYSPYSFINLITCFSSMD